MKLKQIFKFLPRDILFTPFALLIPGWVEENIVGPLLLPLLMDIGDGKQLGLVFHKELVIKNPTDISVESEALGGAVKNCQNGFSLKKLSYSVRNYKNLGGAAETVRTVSFIAAETGRTARL